MHFLMRLKVKQTLFTKHAKQINISQPFSRTIVFSNFRLWNWTRIFFACTLSGCDCHALILNGSQLENAPPVGVIWTNLAEYSNFENRFLKFHLPSDANPHREKICENTWSWFQMTRVKWKCAQNMHTPIARDSKWKIHAILIIVHYNIDIIFISSLILFQ